MKEDTLLPLSRPRMACICAVLAVVSAGTLGAERIVLCEEFTQLSGLPCERAGLALEMLVDDYPDDLAFVQIHVQGDPATSWGTSRFFNFYDFWGTPSTSFDGVDTAVGASSVIQVYNLYRTKYLARLAVATDVTLALSAVHVTGSAYEITATACVEPDGTGKAIRVYIAQVLNHWPPYPTYHRNGLKQMASTADVVVPANSCRDVVRVFTFDNDSWASKSDIKIIAWAQQPSTSAPAEVYQAAWKGWPLVPPSGDFDFDGDVDLDDYVGFADCMGDPEEVPAPTPPTTAGDCLDAFDFDSDSDVDLIDFAAFRIGG